MNQVKEKFEMALKILELGGRRGRYILSARDDGLLDIFHDKGNHSLERIPEDIIIAIAIAKDEAAVGEVVTNYLNGGKSFGRYRALLAKALLDEVAPDGGAEIIIRSLSPHKTPVRREKIGH